MPLDEKDKALLLDIVRACEAMSEFCAGMSEVAFGADRKTRAAVERQIMIVGEAANGLSQDARMAIHGVPRNDIVRMRHIVVHHDGKVRDSELWAVVMRDAPALLGEIRRSQPDL